MLERLRRNWGEMRRFAALPAEDKAIVFYSEGGAYWVHLEPIITSLIGRHGRSICYVSSSPDDPGLALENARVTGFLITEGWLLNYFFRFLEARLLVMTMPDLQTYHIKRSVNPVHYAYVFHSAVSTHMTYRHGAFDHFDTMLAVGPHHEREIRKNESVYGLPEKQIFAHGYGRLDAILQAAGEYPRPPRGGPKRVLVAPSWGANGLLERCGAGVVEVLLGAGYHVTVRPHPETRKHFPAVLDAIRSQFAGNSRFAYEENVASQDSLHRSHLMVSDWSGAALDFAFGLERPVLFVDLPRKVNNAEYERLSITPLEVSVRDQIGAVVPEQALDKLPEQVERLTKNPQAFTRQIRALRKTCIYNLGKSGAAGAQVVADLADRLGAAGF